MFKEVSLLILVYLGLSEAASCISCNGLLTTTCSTNGHSTGWPAGMARCLIIYGDGDNPLIQRLVSNSDCADDGPVMGDFRTLVEDNGDSSFDYACCDPDDRGNNCNSDWFSATGEKHPINDESVGTSSEPVTIAEAEFETEGFAKESSQDLQEDISDTNDILDANSVEYEEHSAGQSREIGSSSSQDSQGSQVAAALNNDPNEPMNDGNDDSTNDPDDSNNETEDSKGDDEPSDDGNDGNKDAGSGSGDGATGANGAKNQNNNDKSKDGSTDNSANTMHLPILSVLLIVMGLIVQ